MKNADHLQKSILHKAGKDNNSKTREKLCAHTISAIGGNTDRSLKYKPITIKYCSK